MPTVVEPSCGVHRFSRSAADQRSWNGGADLDSFDGILDWGCGVGSGGGVAMRGEGGSSPWKRRPSGEKTLT